MEQLVELLNQFEEEKSKHLNQYCNWQYIGGRPICTTSYDTNRIVDFSDLLIISKMYEFIKWLVDNDKIAWRKCLDLWYEIAVIDKEGEDVDIMRTFDDYEQLLMYLAIQDSPIDFLVSILK